MKKLTWSLGVLLAAWGSLALADTGKFQFVHGDVILIRSDGNSVVPRKGDSLEEGDVIATGAQAQAQLVMNDGGLISLRPDSRLRIDQFRFNGKADGSERGIFGLLKGGFRAITGLIGKANKDNYKIRTATATIGIRGTDHEALYIAPPTSGETPIGPPGTYDKVNVGQTYLQTSAGRLDLSSNQVGFAPAMGNTAPQRLPNIPDFLKATPNIQTTTQSVALNTAGFATEKDTPSATNTGISLDRGTSFTAEPMMPSSAVIAPAPSGVFNPANPISAPIGTALAGGGMSSNGPNNGAGSIEGPGKGLAMLVDLSGAPLFITADQFSYNRNAAPLVMSANTTLADQAVRWGVYDGGTMVDNGVSSANTKFYWMTGTNTTTTATLLTALVSGNLTYSTVGGFTKPISESGKVGGTVTSTNITIGNASGVPTLVNYSMALTDAVGRSWVGNLTTAQSLASFQSGGANNLSVSCSGACISTGTGNAQGVVIGNATPVGMISSYRMNAGTASVVGAVLSR